jgi:hypothetical protein
MYISRHGVKLFPTHEFIRVKNVWADTDRPLGAIGDAQPRL